MTERKPNLRPVRELTPTLHYRTIHGYRRAFRIAGSGPAILLIHGIGDNSTTWSTVQSQAGAAIHRHRPRPAGPRQVGQAARRLLGRRLRQRHAGSAQRPRHRAGHRRRPLARRRGRHAIRLPVPAIGGPAHPRRVRRGDQGRQRRTADRVPAAWAPRHWPCCGCRWCCPPCRWSGASAARCSAPPASAATFPTCCGSSPTSPSRRRPRAFARTLRAVVDWRGQVVTMLDRCYLTESVPVQLIWGSHDSVIPVSHARMAHAAMPGAQLEVFEGSGPLPLPRRSRPLRRDRREVHRIDRSRRLRPGHAAQSAARGRQRERPHGTIDDRVAVLDAMGADERSAT